MRPKEKLIPGGILEPVNGKSFLFFGNSYKTSDFLADGLKLWWEERRKEISHIRHLIINMDNGSECNGHRSQFLYRMAEFADMSGLIVQLVYYPPYHSKYNSIERLWAGLEKSWNGYLLDSVTTVINRAASFAWRETKPIVKLIDTVYEKGIKLRHKEKKELESRLLRSAALPWWDITIYPKMVTL
jgi:transposase